MANDTLKKLLAIVQKQQKALEKLAQMQNIPQSFKPVHPALKPELVIEQNLPADVKAKILQLKAQGNVLWVSFKHGMATQAALDAVVKTVQALLNKNLIPFAYEVKAVSV